MLGSLLELLFKMVEPFLPKYMRAGYIRVIILDIDDNLIADYVKPIDNAFTIGTKRFEVHQEQIYRQGRFRVPTIFFDMSTTDPIDLRNPSKENSLSPAENYERMESHIAREVIASFDDDMLAGKTPIIIILGTILIVGAGLWYTMDSSFKDLNEALGLTPVTTSETVSR